MKQKYLPTSSAAPSTTQQFTKGSNDFLSSLMGTIEGGLSNVESTFGQIEGNLDVLKSDAESYQGMLSDYGLAKPPRGWKGTTKYPKTKRVIGRLVNTPFGRETLRKILRSIVDRSPSSPSGSGSDRVSQEQRDNSSETERALRGNKRSRRRR